MTGHGVLLVCIGLLMPVLLLVELFTLRWLVNNDLRARELGEAIRWGVRARKQTIWLIIILGMFILLMLVAETFVAEFLAIWCSFALTLPIFAYRQRLLARAVLKLSSH